MNDAPQIFSVPEPVLACLMIYSAVIAIACFFAGYWRGVAGERKRKGL